MTQVFGLLPFLATGLWTSFVYGRSKDITRSWRWAFAQGCLLLSLFSLVLTELLSALHLLSIGAVLISWFLYAAIPAYFLLQKKSDFNFINELARIRSKISPFPIWALILLGGTTLLIGVMAVASPPMNFDVQIYHLPRQIYWLMQGSVEPFTATHTHQISMPVLSEFLGLNLLILSDGDCWHNLVQTMFLLAGCGVISLLTQCLGGSPRAQLLSLAYLLFVPVVFFEASNAKNDIILAFFVLIPLIIGTKIWIGEWKTTLSLLLTAAIAAGLALATKGTALAYLLPSALFVICACIHRGANRLLLIAILPTLLLTLLPATPQLLRNIKVFHSAAGPNLHHTNLCHDPLSITGVAIRNIVGQYTSGSETWNLALEKNTRSLLETLGINPDDPRTTFEGQSFHLAYFAGLEDIVPAPGQTTLLLFLPFGFLFRNLRKSHGTLPLFLVTFVSLLLFCLIFRWQPWQGRLLIPAYFMAAPLTGIILDQLRPQWLPLLVIFLEILTLKPHLMFAGQRPLFGGASIFRMSKESQMSRMMIGRAEEINTLVAYLEQHHSIHTVMVDGGATEIYGLLRGISIALPSIVLKSGHANHPCDADAVIVTTTHDAGISPPPIAKNPPTPPGFGLSFNGTYYRVFIRN